MRRLLAFLALMLLAFAPVAARALPAMACCPSAMTATMDHGGHRQAPPGDATDCSAHVAAPVVLPAVTVETLPPSLRPVRLVVTILSGLTPEAEHRPPRLL